MTLQMNSSWFSGAFSNHQLKSIINLDNFFLNCLSYYHAIRFCPYGTPATHMYIFRLFSLRIFHLMIFITLHFCSVLLEFNTTWFLQKKLVPHHWLSMSVGIGSTFWCVIWLKLSYWLLKRESLTLFLNDWFPLKLLVFFAYGFMSPLAMYSSGSKDIFILALYQVIATVQRVAESTFCIWWLVVKVLVADNTLLRHKGTIWLSVSSQGEQELCPNLRARSKWTASAVASRLLGGGVGEQGEVGPRIVGNFIVENTQEVVRCCYSRSKCRCLFSEPISY